MEQAVTSLNVYNQSGEKSGELKLNQELESFKPKQYVVHDYVLHYLRNQRQWSASTKTRGEVAGSGKKPWRQKGTGRARAGSLTSPIFRGGGTVFGPRPKDISSRLSKKKKQIAFKSVLAQRIKDGSVHIIDNMSIEHPRTKIMADLFKKMGLGGKVLLVHASGEDNILLSARNLKNVNCCQSERINAYDLVSHPTVVFTRASIGKLDVIQEG